MTRISDLLEAGPTLSFELFPPKTDEAERALEKCVAELAELRPSFVSVTYGALGSTRERTRDVVVRINEEQDFPAMPHLTCVGHSRAD
ncbi:MAG: methylenetetrahydrofolate reductase, partial [Acidimicrobiales bacterium]